MRILLSWTVMLRFVFSLLFLATAVSAGCQYCHVTESWQDHVDHFVDCEPCLDHLYHPEWDVSRIGQPDWCRCRWNRLLWPKACCKYRPMPMPQPVINSVQPDPYIPPPASQSPFPADGDILRELGPVPPLPEDLQGNAGIRESAPPQLLTPPSGSLQVPSAPASGLPAPRSTVDEALAPAAQVYPIFESPIERMHFETPAPATLQSRDESNGVHSTAPVRNRWIDDAPLHSGF